MTEPFIENLEDPEVAKSRKSIINSIIERRAKKPIILVADAEEPDEVIAAQADKAVELAVEDILEAGADQADEAVELVDPEEAKSRKKYYQFDYRTAGEEAKLYLWLTPEKLIKLSN